MYITKHQRSSGPNAPLIKHNCLIVQNSIIQHQGTSSQLAKAHWTKMLSRPTSIMGSLQHESPDPPSTCPPLNDCIPMKVHSRKPPNFRH